MANSIAIIAAVLLGIGGFYAYKTNGALTDLTSSRDEMKTKQDNLQRSIATTTEKRDAATSKGKELTTSADSQQTETSKLESDLSAKTTELSGLETKRDTQKADLEAIKEPLKDIGEVGTIKTKVNDLKASVNDREAQLATLTSRVAVLREQERASSSVATDLTTRLETVNSGNTSEDLRASLVQVYSNEGFVLVSGGDAAGIAGGSKLNVVRGGEVIAELTVTAVEPNVAAASIDPASLADGVALRRGDIVTAAPKAETEQAGS